MKRWRWLKDCYSRQHTPVWVVHGHGFLNGFLIDKPRFYEWQTGEEWPPQPGPHVTLGGVPVDRVEVVSDKEIHMFMTDFAATWQRMAAKHIARNP